MRNNSLVKEAIKRTAKRFDERNFPYSLDLRKNSIFGHSDDGRIGDSALHREVIVNCKKDEIDAFNELKMEKRIPKQIKNLRAFLIYYTLKGFAHQHHYGFVHKSFAIVNGFAKYEHWRDSKTVPIPEKWCNYCECSELYFVDIRRPQGDRMTSPDDRLTRAYDFTHFRFDVALDSEENETRFCSSVYSDYYYRADGQYWLSEEEYIDYIDHQEPERQEYVSGYHSGSTIYFKKTIEKNGIETVLNSKHVERRIGFEIEKTDKNAFFAECIAEFKELYPYWRKERDGSLTSDYGYELISPVFPFNDAEHMELIFQESEKLAHLINADTDSSCGLHINLSESNLSGSEMYGKIEYIIPLLYALYPNRLNNTYSKAKEKGYRNFIDKYSAVCVKNNRVEIRIFPALKNMEQLKFRTNLLFHFLKYRPKTKKGLKRIMTYKSTQNLFRPIYGNDFEQRYQSLNNRIDKYSREYYF